MLSRVLKSVERHPYRWLLVVCAALSLVVGTASHVGTRMHPGTATLSQAAMGSGLLFAMCFPIFGIAWLSETASKVLGNTLVKGLLVGVANAVTVFWIIASLTIVGKFGVSLPPPCAALLSFSSPLVWVLGVTPLLLGLAWGIRESTRVQIKSSEVAPSSV